MQPSAKFNNLIEYTTLAATTAKEIAQTASVPFLGSASVLTLSIVKCVEKVHSNKDECFEMVTQIHEILCTILKLYSGSVSETQGVLPTALLYDIANFTETLEKVFTFLKGQGRMGKIKQVFKQLDSAARLRECSNELNRAQETFAVRATGSTLSHIMQMKKDAKQQHEELVTLLKAHPELTSSDASTVSETLSTFGSSSSSLSMLPPSPQIFHGRESEVYKVVNILIQHSPRIAILGAGGMGKTSLATMALHADAVVEKYSHRYFVQCHSTPTCIELVSAVAAHIGAEKGANVPKKVAQYFMHAPPSLLVLDNLETCWEAVSSRKEVEEFLSLLTDVPQLGLMITMRGAERPAKVKWTHPFLAPLQPISSSAALESFVEVADNIHKEEKVKLLLDLTGYMPLAVSLMASVAAHEGCDKALSRWETEGTLMLSDGYDKRSSLDISIMLSFTSSRMTPGAQDLLSILSMLPDGFTDADLLQAELPITDILASKTTLLRMALAFVDHEKQIQVLAPIREHLLRSHHPPNALKLKLRKYFHGLLSLWKDHRDLDTANIGAQLLRNVGNITSVLQDSLTTDCPDVIENYQSILNLNRFYRWTQDTYSPLLWKIPEQTAFWKDNPNFGDYLIQIVTTAQYVPLPDAEAKIIQGNKYFEFQHPLEQAEWSFALGVYKAQSDMSGSFTYYEKALSLADSTGSPSRIGQRALSMMAYSMTLTGNPHSAQKHAMRAQEYAGALGGIYAQAQSLFVQAECQVTSANYSEAQILLKEVTLLLISGGLEGCALELQLQNLAAEVHLLKTEYLESHRIQATIAATRRATAYYSLLANLNIALIDLACGIDSGLIRKNLDQCQLQCEPLYGFRKTDLELITNHRWAELYLRDGALGTANMMFTRCFALSQKFNTDVATACLERLADLSTGMNNTKTTMSWAGIFLALALRLKDKLAIAKAFCCLGQIFAVQEDIDSALSLFNVALDEFTFMDVHQWRANCMVQIADICESHGEVLRAVGLWKTARPLFVRSSQARDVARIDSKLSTTEAPILEHYEGQLLQLAVLNAPATVADLEKSQDSESEEEQELVDREQKSLRVPLEIAV